MFVLQYIETRVKRISTLTPTREWIGSTKPVITALGANTVAHRAIVEMQARGIQDAVQRVYQIVEGLEAPVIVVPSSLLKSSDIKFRVSADGETHNARKVSQKATQKFQKRAARFVRSDSRRMKAFGLKFGA